MYKPFGKDVKDEMLRCIGFDIALVKRNGRFRYFKATQNNRVVRANNNTWRTLCRCGYAELICTQMNPAAKIVYNTYALTKAGMAWLGRQMGLRIIPPTVIEMAYKEEKVC